MNNIRINKYIGKVDLCIIFFSNVVPRMMLSIGKKYQATYLMCEKDIIMAINNIIILYRNGNNKIYLETQKNQ